MNSIIIIIEWRLNFIFKPKQIIKNMHESLSDMNVNKFEFQYKFVLNIYKKIFYLLLFSSLVGQGHLLKHVIFLL